MSRLMHRSLIVWVHIGLISVSTMALAIVPSSHLTRVGWHGSTIMWCTLTMWGYKAIIRRVSELLIPVPIRLITVSILRPIIRSIRHPMRCPMGHFVSRNVGSRINDMTSRNRDTTPRNNRRYLNLRHNCASSSSTDMAHSDIPTRRTA